MDVEKKIEAKSNCLPWIFLDVFASTWQKQKTLKIHRKAPVLESIFKTASDMRKKEREQHKESSYLKMTPSFGRNLINSVYLICFNLCDGHKKWDKKQFFDKKTFEIGTHVEKTIYFL